MKIGSASVHLGFNDLRMTPGSVFLGAAFEDGLLLLYSKDAPYCESRPLEQRRIQVALCYDEVADDSVLIGIAPTTDEAWIAGTVLVFEAMS